MAAQRKIPCVGFAISGRICARSHLDNLTMMLRFIKQAGWGIVVPLGTTGERHLAREAYRLGVFCVGLFTSPDAAPEFRNSVNLAVDTYTMEERAEVQALYNSMGKMMTWDLMPINRRNLLASMVGLAKLSRIIAVWPDSTETNVAAHIAGRRSLTVYFLPRAFPSLTNAIMNDRRNVTVETKTAPTSIVLVRG